MSDLTAAMLFNVLMRLIDKAPRGALSTSTCLRELSDKTTLAELIHKSKVQIRNFFRDLRQQVHCIFCK